MPPRSRLLPIILLLPLILAAAPTTAPVATEPPLLAQAHHILSTFKESQYTHKTAVDEQAGTYHFDCSGLLDYLLKRTSPAHYHLLPHPPGRRPLAVHFYTAFSTAASPLSGTQRAPGSSPSWQPIPLLKDARPGDVLAWRRNRLIAGDDTGHVVLLDSVPTPDPDAGPRTFRVTVIDSTGSGHADDTRPKGHSGIGRGTMWFDTDAAGHPAAFHWRSPHSKPTTVPIAIARPVD